MIGEFVALTYNVGQLGFATGHLAANDEESRCSIVELEKT